MLEESSCCGGRRKWQNGGIIEAHRIRNGCRDNGGNSAVELEGRISCLTGRDGAAATSKSVVSMMLHGPFRPVARSPKDSVADFDILDPFTDLDNLAGYVGAKDGGPLLHEQAHVLRFLSNVNPAPIGKRSPLMYPVHGIFGELVSIFMHAQHGRSH